MFTVFFKGKQAGWTGVNWGVARGEIEFLLAYNRVEDVSVLYSPADSSYPRRISVEQFNALA